jgi:hypothetical protein
VDVKTAVKSAIAHIHELFDAEQISNVGLEEVGFDEAPQQWVVTVGFSRPWDYPKGTLAALTGADMQAPKRTFKVVRIDDDTGEVVEIKNKPFQVS